MAVEETIYTEADFKKALLQLLPPGDYWADPQEGDDLDQLLTAVAIELLTTHNETKNSFLYQSNKTLSGWKIADFQAILDTAATGGTAYDDPNYPNLIFVLLEQTTGFLDVMQELEAYRLPHTNLNWKISGGLGINGKVRPVTYIRLETQEA